MRNQNQSRKYVIGGMVLLVSVIYLFRLFYIQVIDQSYKLSSNNNSRLRQVEFAARGMIFDRYGKVLVFNEAVFDLLVLPQQVKNFDTLDLCGMLKVDPAELRESLKKAREYSRYRQSPVVRNVSPEQIAALQEKLYKFPGFSIQTRTQRKYPEPIAPHVLGYVGEVNASDMTDNPYYQMGDYIGKSGLESEYEEILRGRKGIHFMLVDVHNRVQGNFDNGRYDTIPEPGRKLTTTIDAGLQQYGEQLLAHKRGSIVAIEPATGEILALISSPGYDPNELVGRVRGQNFERLMNDSLNPLFNRATMSRYSPGSIFKIIQALIALQLGVLDEFYSVDCNKGIIGCHNHPNAHGLREGIRYSCNPYFYTVFRRIILQGKSTSNFRDSEMGLSTWTPMAKNFGLGQVLPVDIPGVKPGLIPDVAYYDKIYGKGRWAFSTIYSNSIGQGEVETVPIQIANLAAIIANRGHYFVPHFIKAIEGIDTIPRKYTRQIGTGIDSRYFDIIADGMAEVVYEPGGTGSRARVPGVVVCGKTGTVQNSQGEDHSGFFAFAPKERPRIAIVAYVENSGAGGTWAAIIASLMIEKYMNGSVTQLDKEKTILEYQQY
ncbi:MAG: penicillin-binding protein 2 [Bacteroidetes bacterium GWF2_49_14]|nr:MAG: penicillin-binding protein 2 [Bacteroidetes bacterium GWF2_49_14]HBB92955.1 penicillin-binding protein 2 [Bacteroidales bacterium]